ncbi:hypothetical protein AALA21_02835 [Eggerthellaceae bacterium 3-80]|nr:hypothetical protein D7W09_04370 [bacterium D16-34]
MVINHETISIIPSSTLIFADSSLTELSLQAYDELATVELAEVLRLWDADTNWWVDNSPIVVRLICCDLIICKPDSTTQRILSGAINTVAPVSFSTPTGEEHICIWKADPGFTQYCGERLMDVPL